MAAILLIDDDEDLRFVLAGFLRDVGHEVVEAADGTEGLEHLEGQAPDLIITDLIMEGMEGIETVLNVNRMFDALPVLAISGNSLYLENSIKLGAAAALLKPFRKHDFLDQVHALLAPEPVLT